MTPANSVGVTLPEQKGRTRDQMGKAVGVSGSLIDRAAKVRKFYDKAAKERQKEGGRKGGKSKDRVTLPEPSMEQRARDAAGKAVGVSGSLIDRAIVTADPQVFQYFQDEAEKAKAEGQREGGKTAGKYRPKDVSALPSIDGEADKPKYRGEASNLAGQAANVSAASVDRGRVAAVDSSERLGFAFAGTLTLASTRGAEVLRALVLVPLPRGAEVSLRVTLLPLPFGGLSNQCETVRRATPSSIPTRQHGPRHARCLVDRG